MYSHIGSLPPPLHLVEHPMAAAPISWLLRVIHSGCHGGNKSFLLHQTDMLHSLLTWTRDSAVVCGGCLGVVSLGLLRMCSTAQPTSDQMRLVLFLASRAVTDPSRHGHPLSFSWDPGALHLPLPLAPGTPPPLRDKVRGGCHGEQKFSCLSLFPHHNVLQFCQCLVEWLGMVTAEPVLRQTCLGWQGNSQLLTDMIVCVPVTAGWFGVLKSTEEFQKSVIWTSVGHLL